MDVRNYEEHDYCNIEGSMLIPLPELEEKYTSLDKNSEIVVYCHTGNRSRKAAEFLQNKNFKNVKNLKGGIDAWSKNIDQNVLIY